MLKTVHIFWNLWYIFQDSLMHKNFFIYLFQIEILCNIIDYCSKVWGQYIIFFLFLKEINTCIQQRYGKLIKKSDSKDLYS